MGRRASQNPGASTSTASPSSVSCVSARSIRGLQQQQHVAVQCFGGTWVVSADVPRFGMDQNESIPFVCICSMT